ncbi:hypothetical protein [Peribacillus huizhouensis]|uniref:Uncharacterized protein n=1 Tax=Peribacillus huizhouensis TaxID=1501239 RepID=A0ABR6CKQ9_9BACI|nr:hypothetical protein [Peribacillus huizhouensis]MBA9025643.1 hypothetical protein [Peribacillus huizhouensis]
MKLEQNKKGLNDTTQGLTSSPNQSSFGLEVEQHLLLDYEPRERQWMITYHLAELLIKVG